MIKVQVLTQCEHCNGEAYVPMSEAEDCQGFYSLAVVEPPGP